MDVTGEAEIRDELAGYRFDGPVGRQRIRVIPKSTSEGF